MNSKHSFFGESQFGNILELASEADDMGYSLHIS